eukprot:CAMPEP_0204271822 /NCGR_PEP_ID=MMETSP0468-20130131/21190_1 /ASSEMBLY_ACC=CAM_ASM_000383 /TAXON_ID=2969 /ORGANISM="Oxyrrhis marina" /LENGTH=228 /DNA_ID=CAMNT_0051247577 /DNA_START=45 /DNA_END=731 /DNA_ORIENTATION=+
MAVMELGYWKIRGLGAPLRMVLEYKEVQYKDTQYAEFPDWFKGGKPAIEQKNPFANLPYLVDGDTVVCQTNAVFAYLAEKLDMAGKDLQTKTLHQTILCESYDVRDAMVQIIYPFKKVCRTPEEFEEQSKAQLENPPFAKFEACLTKSGGDWFVLPDGPSPADFHVWELLDQYRLLGEKKGKADVLDQFPKCKAFHQRVRALPTLQKYFTEGAYNLPINVEKAGANFF